MHHAHTNGKEILVLMIFNIGNPELPNSLSANTVRIMHEYPQTSIPDS